MSLISSFFAQRKRDTTQSFNAIGGPSGKTILVSSHIWWTDLMVLSLLKLGYDVVVMPPWYALWIHDANYAKFDLLWNDYLKTIRERKVKLIIGGNTTAMLPHAVTKEPLHVAAGVPVVHYWWDAPRVAPPMCRRGFTLRDYVANLRDERTLNCIWDIDVLEELGRFMGVTNTAHLPLGTAPEFWETQFIPMADRPVKASFLGTGHPVTAEQKAVWDPSLAAWADQTVTAKLADPDRPMVECVGRVTVKPASRVQGQTPDPDAMFRREFERWEIVDSMLAERVRTATILKLAERLGDELELIGTGWETLGLTPTKPHSGIPGAKDHYAAAKASVNLFGGCVHAGMPLRPYEIASANGLIFTQYQRELPKLYEPGKECVAFKNTDEMLEQLDRLLSSPSDYDAVVKAGRERTIAEHTWDHRMKRVVELATERFEIAW